MKFDCQYVSASESGGEIFQIMLEAERDQEVSWFSVNHTIGLAG